MALGRQSKNVVYHAMGKSKYASAPAKGPMKRKKHPKKAMM